MKKEKAILTRLPEPEKKLVDETAREHGISTNRFIRKALRFYSGLPKELLEVMELEAKHRKLPAEHVFTAKIIQAYAVQRAWLDSMGKPPPSINKPFRFDENGELVWGTKLLKQLHAEYKQMFEGFRDKMNGQQIDQEPFFASHSELAEALSQL